MKTKLTKLFSLLMAGALVLSLAACSGAGDDANTTGAEESNQAPNASETFPPASDESKNPSDSTAEPGVSDASDTGSNASTQKTSDAGTTNNNASKAPNGVNEIVSYYNTAVKKIAKVSGTYSRKITSGSVTGGVNLNLVEQKYATVINRNNTALTGTEATLKGLSASDVASASCKENGNNYVFTISLKNKSGKDSSIKHGAGGYLYFAELSEIEKAVYDIGVVLGVKGIKVSTANLTLSNGKLTVTSDKTSGKISKATLTLTEDVDATASYLFLKPAAKLSVNFTVNYTVS